MLSVESVLSRRDKFVDQWDDSKEKGALEKAGVTIVRGQGHLEGLDA
jgi:pyruvate/2-oxoglutarate dehydrogenase complex dihydrolipoamide dehydrogenase (E3) component